MVNYVQITYALAQVGSVFSILLLVQYLIIFVNEKRLYHTLMIEILKIYMPDLRNRKITYDIFGFLKGIGGMS